MTPKVLGLVILAWLGTGVLVARGDPTVADGYIVERFATGIGAANAMEFGPDGLLYITDYQAGRLLRRSCSGELEVVASGLPNAVGVAFSASGRTFVAAGDTRIYEVVNGVPRVFASGFSYVTSLAVKGDDLYVSNSAGNTISRVSIATGTVSTALGGIVNPHGMSIDSRGDMYVISHSAGTIYRYDFINPPQLVVSIPAYSGTYTGEGLDGALFWGQYQSGTLHRLRDGTAEVFATGFVGGTSPPVIGPNDILAQGSDAILVADGHEVWRIARAGSSTNLESLTLKTNLVVGCKSVSGSIALTGPAPAEGLLVSLSDTIASATAPLTVNVPAGATCRSFITKTQPVLVEEAGIVRATFGSTTVSDDLAVRPIRLSALTLTPTSVAGGNTAIGKVTLECKAGPGPVEVQLSSTNPSVADPVAPSIFVPQGLQAATFDVATSAVLSKTYATISAAANDATKTRILAVTPAASISPTSLRFGSVAIGATSAPSNATLTNKGTTSISIDSIGITGAYGSWFAQTNDCPGTLPAGASCSISVSFSPLAAASRSAKLVISTRATTVPLYVSMSGTGIL